MAVHQEIDELRRCEVVGTAGEKIGKVSEIFLNDETGAPDWVTVRTGLFGDRESFIPLVEATVADGVITVPFDKEHIKGSPLIGKDGSLTVEEEDELFRYYGIGDVPGQGRTDISSDGRVDDDEVGSPEAETAERTLRLRRHEGTGLGS